MVRNETEWRQQVDAWLMGPASPPPPGVTSNLLGGPSLRKYDVLCQAFCLTVVTTLVVVRMYTKGTVLRNIGWDDCELTCSIARKCKLTGSHQILQ